MTQLGFVIGHGQQTHLANQQQQASVTSHQQQQSDMTQAPQSGDDDVPEDVATIARQQQQEAEPTVQQAISLNGQEDTTVHQNQQKEKQQERQLNEVENQQQEQQQGLQIQHLKASSLPGNSAVKAVQLAAGALADLSWLPELLQQQDFYTYCPKCLSGLQQKKELGQESRTLMVCKLRWFNLSAGHAVYCNVCKPTDALCVGKGAGSNGQLVQQVLEAAVNHKEQQQQPQRQADKASRAVLLAMKNTGMKSKVALKVDDAKLLGLDTSHICLWGDTANRNLLLLHPQSGYCRPVQASAAAMSLGEKNGDWQCKDCKTGPGSSTVYCSISCKLHHTGLQGIMLQRGQQGQAECIPQQADQQGRHLVEQMDRSQRQQQQQQPEQQHQQTQQPGPKRKRSTQQGGSQAAAGCINIPVIAVAAAKKLSSTSKKRKSMSWRIAASDGQRALKNSSTTDQVAQEKELTGSGTADHFVHQQQQQNQQQKRQQLQPSTAAAAHANSSSVGNSPCSQARVSREPWDVDLLGVKLGCPRCRYGRKGCLTCRKRARKALAQKGQHPKQQGSQQQQSPIGSMPVAAVKRAAATAQAARAPAGHQQRKRSKTAAPRDAAATAAPSDAAATAAAAPLEQQQKKKRCKAAAVPGATSTPATAGCSTAPVAAVAPQQQPNQISWLPVLLQVQHFYQQCPKCDKEKCPVRWFDIHAPNSTYCNDCRPDDAVRVRSKQHQSCQQQPIAGPLLLPLITSQVYTRLWGSDRVVIPSASPYDLAAGNVNVDNVKVLIRDQGRDIKKEIVLLHPRAAASINQGQLCSQCAELQQSNQGARYCSVACKLRQAGLQSLQATGQSGQQQQQPQQQCSQQQPAKSPAVFCNKYKFPALRLSGPQPSWREDAWQQQKQAGLDKLIQLQAAVVDDSSTADQPAAAQKEHQQECMTDEVQPAADVAPESAAAISSSSCASTAVLLLLHGTGCPNAAIWQSWCDSHPAAGAGGGGVSLFCHMKKGVDLASDSCVGRQLVQRHMLNTRVDAKWGDTSLVKAFLDSLAEVLIRCGVLNAQQTWAIGGASAARAAGEAAGSHKVVDAAAAAQPLVVAEQAAPSAAMQTAGEGVREEEMVAGVAGACVSACQLQQDASAAQLSAAAGPQHVSAVVGAEDQQQDRDQDQQQQQQQQSAAPCSIVSPTASEACMNLEQPATSCPSMQPAITAAAVRSGSSSKQHHQGLRHVLLASGTDIPLKLLPEGALPAGVTLYGSYDYSKEDVADLQEVMYDGMIEAGFSAAEARQWTSCLAPHHQWMCVSVEHAVVLMAMRDQILKVADAVHAAWHEAKCGIAADEYVLITALRVAGCVQALKPCRTPRQLAACEPGTAANCHPTQVMYPIPQEWTQQLQQQGHIEAATSVCADTGKTHTTSTNGKSDCRKGESNSNSCRGAVPAAAASSCAELFKASFVADKHPVTWKGVSDVVWCEEEEDSIVFAAKMTMRNLLAIAAQRGCLTLRKVDCCNDDQAQAELLRLLQRIWSHDAPKVRCVKRVAVIDKQQLQTAL